MPHLQITSQHQEEGQEIPSPTSPLQRERAAHSSGLNSIINFFLLSHKTHYPSSQVLIKPSLFLAWPCNWGTWDNGNEDSVVKLIRERRAIKSVIKIYSDNYYSQDRHLDPNLKLLHFKSSWVLPDKQGDHISLSQRNPNQGVLCIIYHYSWLISSWRHGFHVPRLQQRWAGFNWEFRWEKDN